MPFYNDQSLHHFCRTPDNLAAFHLEASECYLIHVDNELRAKQGVWLNPNINVGDT
jgi:hypothetical protein